MFYAAVNPLAGFLIILRTFLCFQFSCHVLLHEPPQAGFFGQHLNALNKLINWETEVVIMHRIGLLECKCCDVRVQILVLWNTFGEKVYIGGRTFGQNGIRFVTKPFSNPSSHLVTSQF